MTQFGGWLSPSVMHPLGWALLLFLWQGAVLAALFAAALTIFGGARARYALGVATLMLMLAAPVVTFLTVWHQASTATSATGSLPVVIAASRTLVSSASAGAPATRERAAADLFPWLVETWLVGVILLGLRAAGGLVLLERLERREAAPATSALRSTCLDLQRRLGIDRAIRYCECRMLEAPAVIGWFRPVVLLPATALMGLRQAQLEAVIAHELAHIRRLDGLVNLLQMLAETLLFYHPAVWWVSHRIRAERENCCDDIAVSVCGDAVAYASTLVSMAEWRSRPSLAMAANHGSLSRRVARLLGIGSLMRRSSGAGWATVALCLAGALLVGTAFLGAARSSLGLDIVKKTAGNEVSPAGTVVRRSPRSRSSLRAVQAVPAANPSLRLEQASAPAPASEAGEKGEGKTRAAADEEKPQQNGKKSFIDELKAVGLGHLTPGQLVAMKNQGVTPEYVRQIHELGLQPNPDELIAMRVEGVSGEYVRTMRAEHLNPTVEQLVAMRTQGVAVEFVREIKGLGLQPNVDELMAMRVQDVTPEYVREMRAAGFDPTTEQFVAMRTQGVTSEYVRGLQELGLKPNADELVGMRVQGVTQDYIRQIRATDLNPTIEQLIGLHVQGVTPEYVRTLQAAGLGKLRVDDYIAAKSQGIDREFLEKVRKHGFQNLDLEKLIALKQADVL